LLIGLILFFGPSAAGTTRLDVLDSVLAVLGVWVGAVIAFYFGSENMELAQRGIKNTIDTLTSDRLKTILAEEAMLTPVYMVNREQLINEAIDLLEKKKVDSVVVVDNKDKPLGILYYKEILKYIAEDPEKYGMAKKRKISEVMKTLGWDKEVRNNFLPVYRNSTLGSIKTNLEDRKIEYAIVVGTEGEAIGILSRLEILKQAFMGK